MFRLTYTLHSGEVLGTKDLPTWGEVIRLADDMKDRGSRVVSLLPHSYLLVRDGLGTLEVFPLASGSNEEAAVGVEASAL